MKLDYLLTLFTKIISETIKLLEENINDMSLTSISAIFFLAMPSQARAKKAKINKWNYKLKTFCTVKEIMNKTKRHPIEWEEISANDIFHK